MFVYEPQCEGLEHVAVNAAFLEIVLLQARGERVVMHGERAHLAALDSSLGAISSEVTWQEILLPPRRAASWSRFLREFRNWRRVASAARAQGRGVLVLSCDAATVLSIKLLSWVCKTPPVQVVIHGIAAELRGWRSRNPFRKVFDFRFALDLPSRGRIRYIVLEEGIREAILQLRPQRQSDTFVVPHPIGREEAQADLHVRPPSGDRLTVGFLGLATPAKGFDCFLDLASRFRADRRVEFHAIGTFAKGWRPDTSALSVPPRESKLSRADYVRAVRALDIVCLPFHGDHYELVASGAMLDAIANLKPLLAFPTTSLRHLERAQPIGYLCESVDEMAEVIRSLAGGSDQEGYLRRVAGMRNLRHARSPAELARQCAFLSEPDWRCPRDVG